MNSKRIQDKITEIEKYLQELEEIVPASFEEYSSNLQAKAACERYTEKITEALCDLSFLVLRELGTQAPEDDKQLFAVLARKKVIDVQLSEKLQKAKAMRNFLAHRYAYINDHLVYSAVKNELKRDATNFIKAIKNTAML